MDRTAINRAELLPIEAALNAGEFARALELLDALKGPVTPERLDLRGRAAYGAGDLEATLTAYEQLHRLHLGVGRTEDAALAAVMVGMYLMMESGLMAPVRAWLSRAERLLRDAPDSPVWAWLFTISTYERLMCGDMPGTGRSAQRAIDEGHRHGLVPPILIGRVALARVRIHDGHIDEGLGILDDVALEMTTRDLDPLTMGQLWCELICAMQWIGQHDRAEEWTEAMERWRRGAAFGSLNGRCRVHRAEILRMRGPCDVAEQEALLACEELRPWMRREFGWPLTELGNVRFRKGDFAGAEEAFLAAHENAWSPQPGLALLRLAQGRVEEAFSLIDSALKHPCDIPSKEQPPSGDLRRAPLLDAQVPIALAAKRGDVARTAAAELARIAEVYRSRTLKTAALAARGRVALWEGRPREAIGDLTAAIMDWVALRMPFEAATARVVLSLAYRTAGDVNAAELELDAACRTFEHLNAPRWTELARRQAAPTDELAPAPAQTATSEVPRDRSVFRCDGDTRTVTFDGTTVLLKDLKGMRYLERLLAEPHREFHALDLVSVERGALPTPSHGQGAGSRSEPYGVGLEVFDKEAREAYRRRLAEVEDDLAEAEAHNDLERAALARADRQFLIDELCRGVGLNGRARTVGGGVERARTAATRSVRYAIERIAEHHPVLGAHLEQTIRTGTYFVYEPDIRAPIEWEVSTAAERMD